MTTQIQTTTATNEVTVNLATGEAFISQRKLAIELGIHHSSLQTHLSTRHPNVLISEGIPSNILQETATYFAYKSKAANATAEAFVKRIKGFASILGEGSVSVAEYLDVQGKPRPNFNY